MTLILISLDNLNENRTNILKNRFKTKNLQLLHWVQRIWPKAKTSWVCKTKQFEFWSWCGITYGKVLMNLIKKSARL